MNSKQKEKYYEKVIEKIIEEESVPETERAANMLAQLEADMDDGQHKKKNSSIKVGRNDPCPCGSGKKYKKCCGR